MAGVTKVLAYEIADEICWLSFRAVLHKLKYPELLPSWEWLIRSVRHVALLGESKQANISWTIAELRTAHQARSVRHVVQWKVRCLSLLRSRVWFPVGPVPQVIERTTLIDGVGFLWVSRFLLHYIANHPMSIDHPMSKLMLSSIQYFSGVSLHGWDACPSQVTSPVKTGTQL
jgi:hypothetical protein